MIRRCAKMGERFNPGDTVLTSLPFVHVISAKYRFRVCDFCFANVKDKCGINCSACEMITFCSEACREESIESHVEECRYLTKLDNLRFFLDDQVLLLLRLHLKLRREDCDPFEYYSIGKKSMKRRFAELMDHSLDIKIDSQKLLWERFIQLSMILPHRELPSWDKFVSYFGKLLINSFSIRTDRLTFPDPVGSGLFLAASVFDHSCEPNAQTVFQGRRLIVKATDMIADFSSVRLSYIDVLEDKESRNERLEAVWYFTCDCRSCLQFRSDDRQLMRRSLKCHKCGNPRALTRNRGSFASSSCPHCGLENEQEASRLRLYKYLLNATKSARNDEAALEKLAPELLRTFHEYDVNAADVLRRLQQWHHSRGNFRKSAEYGKVLERSLDFYGFPHHSGKPLLLQHLAEAYLALNDRDRARKYVREADSYYKIIPGIDHPFYKLDFEPLRQQLD